VAGSDHNLALNQNDDLFNGVSIIEPLDLDGELVPRTPMVASGVLMV
jgi:hypothetical protein